MMSNSVIYIVLTYNNYIDTINTLKCIQKQKYKPFDILCIDNKSEEGYKNNVSKYCKENSIEYIYREINDGYVGGNNFGWKLAKERDYDYVVICNNDILFYDDFLTAKIVNAFYSHDKIAVIGANIVTKDGVTIKEASTHWIFLKLARKNNFKNEFFTSKAGVMGCFLAIRQNIVKCDELFDTSFFMYADEVNLELSLIFSGYYIGYLNDNTDITHLGGDFNFKRQPLWSIYLAYRNSILCGKKLPHIAKIIYLLLNTLVILRLILRFDIPFEKKKFILKGFVKGLYFLFSNKNKEFVYQDALKTVIKYQNEQKQTI